MSNKRKTHKAHKKQTTKGKDKRKRNKTKRGQKGGTSIPIPLADRNILKYQQPLHEQPQVVSRSLSAPFQDTSVARQYWMAKSERGKAIQTHLLNLIDYHTDLAENYKKQLVDIEVLLNSTRIPGLHESLQVYAPSHMAHPRTYEELRPLIEQLREERVHGMRTPRIDQATPQASRLRREFSEQFPTEQAQDYMVYLRGQDVDDSDPALRTTSRPIQPSTGIPSPSSMRAMLHETARAVSRR